jgi:selenide,water dikinase
MQESPRLTQLSKGSGCGCKIQPSTLKEILDGMRYQPKEGDKIVLGNSSNDDASVYDLGNGQYLLQTVDFFTPMVDDPIVFGKAAAANALSDIYAMGGRPIMANALLAWPLDSLPIEMAKEVMKGGEALCSELGVPLVGGHSVDVKDPLFGLSVTGLVDAERLRTNAMAKAGDIICVTKPVGIGMLAAAHKRGISVDSQNEKLFNYLTQSNHLGEKLSVFPSVRAMTDITGFGLLGHATEIALASGVNIELTFSKVPVIQEADALAKQFILPDNAMRNWNEYEHSVIMNNQEAFPWMVDPQTNGGLLFTCDPDEIQNVLNSTNQEVWVIGECTDVQEGEKPMVVVN